MDNHVRHISFPLLALLAVGGAFAAGVLGAVTVSKDTLPAAAVTSAPVIRLPEESLIARAAILYDMRSNRVLFQKNATESLPLASLTKLMAVEVVLSAKSPDTLVEITRQDIRTEGESGLRVGDAVRLGDLIKLALVASSNDAMEAAASSLGENAPERMNAAAIQLGLTKTRFHNATGLDVNQSTSGAYGSAYDVARLAALFYNHHPDFFELTTKPEVSIETSGKELSAEATTVPLQSIPGFVAAKTGYTDLAGGNLVAVFDLEPGHTVIAAVLGSTREGRFSDVAAIIEAARKAL